MANCGEIQPLLSGFEDGELEPHEMHEVARHLASCTDCEAALNDFASIGRRLRDSVTQPSLEGFTAAVQARLAELPVPVRTRIQRALDSISERWIAGLTLSSAALALGAWAAILFLPAARQLLTAADLARNSPSATSNEVVAQSSVPEEQTVNSEGGGQIVISRLETENPSVAVWNEPDSKTTVIWMPDEAEGN